MSKHIVLSVVVLSDGNYQILHKTFLSLFESISKSKLTSYEIIVFSNDPSDDLKKYLSIHHKLQNIHLVSAPFKDSGLAKNFAISKAQGEYIMIIHAGDMVSSNWFSVIIPLLHQRREAIIIHPEASLTFGNGCNTLWLQKSSTSKKDAAMRLLGTDQWAYMLAGHRKIFSQHHFIESCNGYGNDAYFFNIETSADGINHIIAPSTVHFYRARHTSGDKVTQPYTTLFDFDLFSSKTTADYVVKKSADIKKIDSPFTRLTQRAKQTKIIRFLLRPIFFAYRKIAHQAHGRSNQSTIPDFVLQSWLEINHIENQLFPYDYCVRELKIYDSSTSLRIDGIFGRLAEQVKFQPDFIFIVPWVIRGGADKVLINYCQALKDRRPNWRILVISTSPSDNPWLNKLPDNTTFLDFGNLSAQLEYGARELLFTRIITQLKCRRLHIINSDFAFLWCQSHQVLIQKHYEVSASLFCHDIVKSSVGRGVFSYDYFIMNMYPLFKQIFTDNQAVINECIAGYGLVYDKKFKVHYQPIEQPETLSSPRPSINNAKINVLWASRIFTQKIPEMVPKIAKLLKDSDFQIDMFGKVSPEYDVEQFDGLNNLKYKGEFNGLNSINLANYDVFLYTSEIDGLPNILLEATAAGLPIIASNTGGISEFIIDQKTGLLVDRHSDPTAYAKALKFFREHRTDCVNYVLAAQKLLNSRHNNAYFGTLVDRDFPRQDTSL